LLGKHRHSINNESSMAMNGRTMYAAYASAYTLFWMSVC